MALQLLLVLGLFFVKIASTDSKIRCSVPPVKRGEATNITCFFGNSRKGTVDDFVVQQYPQGGGFQEITFCYRDNSERLECQIHGQGYQNHGLHDGIFTLAIQNATEDHVGRYMCQAVPSTPNETVSCNFTLKDSPPQTTSGEIVTGGMSLGVASSTREQTTFMESDDEDTDSQTLLIAVSVVASVFLVVAVAVVVRCLRRRRHIKQREKDAQEASSPNPNGKANVLTTTATQDDGKDTERNQNHELQPLMHQDEACHSDSVSKETGHTTHGTAGKYRENHTKSNSAMSSQVLPSPSGLFSAKSAPQSQYAASSDTRIQNREPTKTTTDKSVDPVSSRKGAQPTESAVSPPLNTARAAQHKGSAQVNSERKAKYPTYDQALKKLQEKGAVIIAGPERCGKTNFGQNLLSHFTKEGYTESNLRDLEGWWSCIKEPNKKFVFLLDEVFTAQTTGGHSWATFFKHAREKQFPIVVIIRSSEKNEKDVKSGLFPCLQDIPVVFFGPAPEHAKTKTKESGSKQ